MLTFLQTDPLTYFGVFTHAAVRLGQSQPVNRAKSHTEGMKESTGESHPASPLKTNRFRCPLVFCFSEKKNKTVHDCFCDSGFSIFLLTSVRIESVGGIKG